jgi:hypothetical protein
MVTNLSQLWGKKEKQQESSFLAAWFRVSAHGFFVPTRGECALEIKLIQDIAKLRTTERLKRG